MMPEKPLDEVLALYKKGAQLKEEKAEKEKSYRIVGFYKETKLKETELGEIPEDWRIVELGEIFKEVNKKVRKIKIEDDKNYKLVTVKLYAKGVTLRNIKQGKDIKTKTMYVVREGDFIFSKIDARNGAYGFVPSELDGAIVSSDFPVLNLIEGRANRDYISYYLSQPIVWELVRNYAIGTTNRQRIKAEDFLKIAKIPLPPLEEQWGIARILSAVDSAIQKSDELIAKIERLKKGLMQELLTKGLGHTKFKKTEIGIIPEEWKVVELGNSSYFKIIMGQSPPSSTYNKDGEGLPFLQGSAEFGSIYPTPQVYTTQPKKIIKEKDILISVRAPVGEVNIAPFELCIGRGLAAIRTNPSKVDYRFIFYLLLFTKSELESVAGGSTFKGITKKSLENLKIPLPPLKEQKKIAKILSAVDKWLELERKRKKKLERLKRGLMNELLTGKIRVKVEANERI